jgi:hypothetical protein
MIDRSRALEARECAVFPLKSDIGSQPTRPGRIRKQIARSSRIGPVILAVLLMFPLLAAAVGSTNRYTYDAAGNIVAIKNVSADALTFTSFSPNKAPFLAQVTLYGTGFSLTTTDNVVSFNGAQANVVSATTTSLVVQVPSNAHTGRISVSIGSALITNPAIFTVDTSLQAPTIASFSPAIVTSGSLVTLTGTNYDPLASNDTLTFNTTVIPPNTVSPTQIKGSTPATIITAGVTTAGLGSGKITVSTAYGTAVSATDLIVVPYGYAATDIGPTPRGAIGGASTAISIPVGKLGMVLFDGVQGERVAMGITQLVTQPANTVVNATLIQPDGKRLEVSSCSGFGLVGIYAQSVSCYLPLLPSTGTYTLLFNSASTATTKFTVTLSKEIVAPLTTASQSLSLSRAAQSEQLTFLANEASAFTVEVAGITLTPATATLYGILYDPDGNAIQSVGTAAGGMVFHEESARQHGTYTLLLQADSGATVRGSAMLDAGVNLPINGAAAVINTTLTGKPVKYTFNATAGQNLGLALTGLTLTPSSTTNAGIVLLNPDGTSNGNISGYSYNNSQCASVVSIPGGCSWNLMNLPQTGTYTLFFMPNASALPTRSDAALMHGTVTLSSDIQGTLSTNVPLAVNLTRAGQKERLSFPVTAGHPFGIQVGGVTTAAPAGSGITATIRDPSNAVVQSANSFGDFATGGVVLYVPNPSVSGTYTVLIEPDGGATGAAVVTLGGTTLVADGAPAVINTTAPGMAMQYTFSATQGQNLGLALTGLTLSPASFNVAGVVLYNPDGTANSNINTYTNNYICYSVVFNPTGCSWDLLNLPQTGLYTLFIMQGMNSATPARVDAASMSATVSLSSDVSPAVIAGTPFSINLSRAGQNERLSVNAVAGHPLAVEIAGIATTPALAGMTAVVYDPSGTYVQSVNSNNGSNSGGLLLYVASPTVSGVYSIVIEPNNGATGTATVTVDPGTALAINAAATINASIFGQSNRFNFSVTTPGQNITVALTGLMVGPAVANTYGYATVALRNPDGSANGAFGSCGVSRAAGSSASCAWNFTNLGVGNYTLIVMPGTYSSLPAVTDGVTLSATLTVSGEIAATPVAGTATVLNLAQPGQSERLSVSVTAGQPLAVEIAGIATTPSVAGMTAALYDPSGAYVQGLNSNSLNNPSGLLLYMANPSVSGTYTVVVQPNSGATGTATATVDAGVALAINGAPANVSTTLIGQAKRFNVSVATAGQNITVALTGLMMGPAVANTSGFASVALRNPDGSGTNPYSNCWVLRAAGSSTSCTWNFTNLAVGNYTLMVMPGGSSYLPAVTDGLTMSATLTVSGEIAVTPVAGTATVLNLAQPGQSERLSVSVTAGHPLAVEIAGISTSPAAAGMVATVFDPSGTYVQSVNSNNLPNSGGLLLYVANPPVSGVYSVVIEPNSGATGTATATLDAGVALAINTAATINTSIIGQSSRFNFSVTTPGQNISVALTGLMMGPAVANTSGFASVALRNPDGSGTNPYSNCWVLRAAGSSTSCTWNFTNLAVGNYTLMVMPGGSSYLPAVTDGLTMSATLTVSGEIAVTPVAGTATVLNLAQPGQSERLSVSVTAGHPLAVEIAGISTSPAAAGMVATVFDPSGTYVQSVNSNNLPNSGGLLLYVANPPVSGVYSVVIEPNSGATGTATATLDAGVALAINTAATINTSIIGQSSRFNFSVTTPGQNITVALTGLMVGPAVANTYGYASVALRNPDGSANGAISGCGVPRTSGASASCAWDFTNLAVGNYTLIVMPGLYSSLPSVTDGVTLSATLTLSGEIAAALSAGTPQSINLSRPGQTERLSFAASAGSPIAIEVAGITPNPSVESLSASILDPGGSQLVFPVSNTAGGILLYVPSAPTTGTYTVLIRLTNAAAGSAQITLDAGTALPTTGATANFTTTVSGQSLVYRFAGTASQNLTLSLSALSMTPGSGYMSAIVYGPTGTTITSAEPLAYAGGTGQLVLSNLPSTGNYTVVLFPGNAPPTTTAFTMSGTLSLH